MSRFYFCCLLAALLSCGVSAQTLSTAPGVKSNGAVTPNDCAEYVSQTVIQDSGQTCAGLTDVHALIAPATGTPATDTASINAAITAAGTGGSVVAPYKQTYVVGGCGLGIPGSATVLPALIDLNGSEITVTSTVAASTTASGVTGQVSASATPVTIPMTAGGGSGFCAGDYVFIRDASYANMDYTYPALVTSKTANSITVASIVFANGGPTSAGGSAIVERVDLPLQFGTGPSSPLTGNIRITNGVFDGNASNRSAQSQNWSYGNLVFVNSVNGHAVVDHNVFQNSLVNGLEVDNASYAKVSYNRFVNIAGNGMWPGGNGGMVDFIETNNTFSNAYQFTGSTTPTVAQYGHTVSTGAMSTSTGPARVVIADNVVDTSTGYCFSTVRSSGPDTQYAITGNVFYHCDMGGWLVTGGGYANISGNLVQTAGHDTPYVSGNKEVTQVQGTGVVVITGNELYDAVLNLDNDAQQVTVTGNLFDDIDLSNTHRSTNTNILASLFMSSASTYAGAVSIAGNTFINPTGNITDALDDIRINTGKHIAVTGNEIYGGWIGLFLNTATDVTVNGNNFVDQANSNSSFQNTAAILAGAGALINVVVSDNTLFNDNTSTNAWSGVDIASPASFANVAIRGNAIDSSVAPVSSANGIRCGSETGAGLTISGNSVTMASTSPASINCPSLVASAFVEWNHLYPTSVTFHQGSSSGAQIEYFNTVTLSSGTASVTGLPFAASSTYFCIAQDQTTVTNNANMIPSSGAAATVTGLLSDVIFYDCKGS